MDVDVDVDVDHRRLTRRLARLERRVTGLETQGRQGGRPAGRVHAGDGSPDPERFWALAGLRSRTSDGSAVLFTGAVSLPGGENYEWQQGVDVDSLLGTDWTLASHALAALGHPVRLMILREVLGGTHTVAELGVVEGFATTGQLYHHFRQLVAAGWLRNAERGRYEVPAARVIPLLVILAAAQR